MDKLHRDVEKIIGETIQNSWTNKVRNYEPMASEKLMSEAMSSVAQQNGFRSGHYTVVLDSEKEYIHSGIMKKYRIVHSDGRVLYLLVKLPSTTEGLGYSMVPVENRFHNNVHYFTNVQPTLKQYGMVPTAPKLYAFSLTKNEEYLILEDLEARGYKRIVPSQGLAKAELTAVLNTLSTFHLTVRYWKTRNLSEFKHMCSQFKLFIAQQNRDKMKDYERILKHILHAAWVLSRPVYNTTLKPHIEQALTDITKKLLKSLGDVQDQPWATLVNCHIWSNNLLIRYHTVTGGPIDVAFEDWSSARIGSPIIDMSFLGFSSTNTGMYPQLQTLLDEYFTSYLPRSELNQHYPIYGIFGVYGSLVVNVATAFENEISMLEFKSDTLTEDTVTSDVIPDIRTRVLSIVKTAVDIGIM